MSGPQARRLRLMAAVNTRATERPEAEPFVQRLEQAADEYRFDELTFSGAHVPRFLAYAGDGYPGEGYPRVAQTVDGASLERFRALLRRFTRRGVGVTLGGPEPRVPAGFFAAYPAARDVGAFCEFLRAKVGESFRQLPEMDCLDVHFWEADLTGDHHLFADLTWGADDPLRGFPYHAPADYLTRMIVAYAEGAAGAGKRFRLLTFSHYPWQERLLIEALKNVPRGVPLRFCHKCVPGDWTPFRQANNVLLDVPDRPGVLFYDGAGEYWGQSQIPYCYPEEIQQRLLHALAHNPNLDTLGMRVNWQLGHVFGAPNEVNWHALAALAGDPGAPIEEIWRGWAAGRFGAAAAPRVVSALRRTNEIGNRIYYIHGAWVHNHSAVSDLGYLESHVVNHAKSTIEWNPHDFRQRAKLLELVEGTREHTVEWVVADRLEALRLSELSLADVQAARPHLRGEDYDLLTHQLRLQRRLAEVSIPHIEAFLRYRIEGRAPLPENRRKLDAALERIERAAGEVEREYGEQVPLLTGRALRRYAEEVRRATQAIGATQATSATRATREDSQ